MVTVEALLAALALGGRGAQVPVPLSTATGVQPTAVFSCALPDFMSSPFVITAGPLSGNGALAVGSQIGAALELTFGAGNQNVTVQVDLPVGGTVVQVPPCGFLRVNALVNPPAADIPGAGWSVFVSDGDVNAPHPYLTAPYKSFSGAETKVFQRPALATAYRVFSPTTPGPSGPSWDIFQTNTNGAVILTYDQEGGGPAFYSSPAATNGFIPLHPLATEVQLVNAPAGFFTVQWLIALGGIG